MRRRGCKNCKEKFQPSRPLQYVCSPSCAFEYHRARQQVEYAKAKKKELAKRREKLKSKSDFAREAQVEFNKYIRERDWDLPCCSCGIMTGQMHAGHYRTTRAASQLRYNTWNVHKQCSQCNLKHSGNIIQYRQELVIRIGQDRVEWLENNHDLADYSIAYLKRLKAVFRRRANQYRKRRQKRGCV